MLSLIQFIPNSTQIPYVQGVVDSWRCVASERVGRSIFTESKHFSEIPFCS